MKGKLKAHLEFVGAADLAGLSPAPLANPITMYSRKNPSVALRVDHGKAQILYGLQDPNFSPAQISYDENGEPEFVRIANSDRSGHQNFRPEDKIVTAILTAAKSQPVGRGYAVAALAKAAHATNEHGDHRWGVGLISSASHMDTANLPATHNAVKAIQRQWSNSFMPSWELKPG